MEIRTRERAGCGQGRQARQIHPLHGGDRRDMVGLGLAWEHCGGQLKASVCYDRRSYKGANEMTTAASYLIIFMISVYAFFDGARDKVMFERAVEREATIRMLISYDLKQLTLVEVEI